MDQYSNSIQLLQDLHLVCLCVTRQKYPYFSLGILSLFPFLLSLVGLLPTPFFLEFFGSRLISISSSIVLSGISFSSPLSSDTLVDSPLTAISHCPPSIFHPLWSLLYQIFQFDDFSFSGLLFLCLQCCSIFGSVIAHLWCLWCRDHLEIDTSLLGIVLIPRPSQHECTIFPL